MTDTRGLNGAGLSTIRMSGGGYLDLLDPQPGQIRIEDIAAALSKICRFGGQIDEFYSVADHSINAARLADHWGHDRETQFAALMHDAAEAYCGDVVKPLKDLLPVYDVIEFRLQRAIGEKFGVSILSSATVERSVIEIDQSLLHAERRKYFTPDAATWSGEHEVRPAEGFALDRHATWRQARATFLGYFNRLKE